LSHRRVDGDGGRAGPCRTREHRREQAPQVFAPLPEGWQRYREPRELGKKIGRDARDRRARLPRSQRRQDARDARFAARSKEGQEGDLRLRAQPLDLVEVERSSDRAGESIGQLRGGVGPISRVVTTQERTRHRHERASATGRVVDGASDAVLSAPRFAHEQYGDPAPRCVEHPGEEGPVLVVEGGESGSVRLAGRVARAITAPLRKAPRPEQQIGVAELENSPVGEVRALDPPPVEVRAVARVGVLEEPSAARASHRRVHRRHPRVRHLDDEPTNARGRFPDRSPLLAASKENLVHIVEAVPRGPGRRAVALQDDVKIVVIRRAPA
jgi:hypothetical protein